MAKREGDVPRNAHEVFVFQTTTDYMGLPAAIVALRSSGIFVIAVACACVAIPKVQPQHPIVGQQLAHQPEYLNYVLDVFLWSGFDAELRVDAAGTAHTAHTAVVI